MQNETMPPSPKIPLTLIVAATPSLGIGANGTLPWRIKSELQYFARITTRVPISITSRTTNPVQNAVIMGRKTWESIPSKFRPLKGRVNVVLSSKIEGRGHGDGAIWAGSLEEAVKTLQRMSVMNVIGGGGEEIQKDPAVSISGEVARVFVIGGAAVYKAALELPETERVLLTKVQGDNWGCDTFFPVHLEGEEGEKLGWHRKSNEELKGWVEEEVPEGLVKEGDVEFEYCMFEKEVVASR